MEAQVGAPPSGPLQLRIALAHVDRGIERALKVIIAANSTTTSEQVILRVVAYCLFFEDGLRLVERPVRRDVPDLELVEPDGKVSLWIGCGGADADEIRRVVAHNRDARVHVLFTDPAARDRLLEQLAAVRKRPPGFERVSVWTVEEEAVASLATRRELRQRWTVTVVGDHLYVDSDGLKVDTAVTRHPVPDASVPAASGR
jgi:uncharacterized protein YaeQ